MLTWVLFIAFSGLSLFKFRLTVLIFPFLAFVTPKGLPLIDIAALPYLSLNRALVMVLAASLVLRILLKRTHFLSRRKFPLTVAFCLLSAAYFLSLVANPSLISENFFTSAISLLEIIVPCFLVHKMVKDERSATHLLYLIVVTAAIVSTYGTIAYYTDWNPFYEYMRSSSDTARVNITDYAGTLRGARAVGTFSHPITYGAFLAISIFVAISLLFDKPAKPLLLRAKIILVIAIIVMLVGIAATNSRTPMVMLLIGLVIAWVTTTLSQKLQLLVFSAVMLVSAASFAMPVLEKYSNGIESVLGSGGGDWHGSTVEMRLLQLNIAAEVFSEAPIVGGGATKTRSLIGLRQYEDFYNAESAVFQWAINFGIFGILAYAILLVQVLLVLNSGTARRPARSWLLGLWIGYVAFIFATGVMETMQFALMIAMLALIAFPAHSQRLPQHSGPNR